MEERLRLASRESNLWNTRLALTRSLLRLHVEYCHG
jgi:hypothetical protein